MPHRLIQHYCNTIQSDRCIRRSGLIVLWPLLLFCLVAACNTQPVAIETIQPNVDDAADTATSATEAPSEISTQQPEIESDVAAVEPAASPTFTATPTPTPIPYAGDPCGAALPLLPAGPRPVTSTINQNPDLSGLPENVVPAVERLLAAPETVALAAFEVGNEANGIFWNADAPMPIASVAKILTLIAYAEAVVAEEIDPDQWIDVEDLARFFLPNSDLGAHNTALVELAQTSRMSADRSQLPLHEIPWMMIRHSSNAASDYLHFLLGQATVEQVAVDQQMTGQTAPCPFLGQFLAMHYSGRLQSDRAALDDYLMEPAGYGLELMELAHRFSTDSRFRQANRNWGRPVPSVSTQAAFADQITPRGTAWDYAQLMGRIVSGELGLPRVNTIVRQELEWPIEVFASNRNIFSVVGYKDGSLPGVLNSAYYARRIGDSTPVVVVLLYRDLPQSTYRRWRRELHHDDFARWLLIDPTAIETLRQIVSP